MSRIRRQRRERQTLARLMADDPRWSRRGFADGLRAWIDAHRITKGDVRIPERVPDLWRIDGSTAYILEVEDSAPLKPDKLSDYGLLWFYLECHDLDLILVRCDPFGVFQREVTGFELYYGYTIPMDAEKLADRAPQGR